MTRFQAGLGGVAFVALVVASSIATSANTPPGDSVPCLAWANAVTANTGAIVLDARSVVDSYASTNGLYGGGNVGAAATITTATPIVDNGGVLRGHAITNTAAGLAVVPVPSGALNLPLGSTSPGNLNVNGGSSNVTLAPGDYVAANIDVNFPGAITVSPPGEVRIWVTGNLNLGGNENLNGLPSNLAFLVTSSGFVNVNSGGSLFGLIYAPTSQVSLDSSVFGAVVGSAVTLNSGSAVHYDLGSACNSSTSNGSPPTVASNPPRTLPLPPTTQGCYQGTANGWVAIACTPPGQSPRFVTLEDQIRTIDAGASTVPLQFAQVESTLTAFGSEADSVNGTNALSLQGNTAFFTGSNGDTDWVQFVIGSAGTQSEIDIQTWDITTFTNTGGYSDAGSQCGNACEIECGCTTYGAGTSLAFTAPTNIPNRPSGYVPFDYATVAGSVYQDVNGAPVIGMVAQFSWYYTADDPNDNRGLYAMVAPDQYDLAHHWGGFSGTIVGEDDGATANFTSSSVLTSTLVGSCTTGTGPVSDAGGGTGPIPWPGNCPGSPALLPSTTHTFVQGTGEGNNLCEVGSATPLVAASTNLVYSQNLFSTSCSPASCISTSDHIFIKTTDEDTGVRPINVGVQPFWQSPDLFLVPTGSPVALDGVSTETLVTPGDTYDVWVRVHNDFGCDAVTGAKALVYLAQPSALSTSWFPISTLTGSTSPPVYLGSTNGTNPNGVTVPAGVPSGSLAEALIGPFTFTAPTSGFLDGHICLLAAIEATNETGPTNTTDPLSSNQVGQRNLQFSNCELPLTNATTSNGEVKLTLTESGVPSTSAGETPSLTGPNALTVTFPDPTGAFATTFQGGAGAGTAYSVTASGGQTTVRLGQTSVTLPAIVIAAGTTVSATANVGLGLGQPSTTLQVLATLANSSGTALAPPNGVSCVQLAGQSPPPPPDAGPPPPPPLP